MSKFNYVDLFAGAGGLSEGFIRAGFEAIAHVEMNPEACDTLRTRIAGHYLKEKNKSDLYNSYLKKEISREQLWNFIPKNILQSVINSEISNKTIDAIFAKINARIGSAKIDIICGGPPCQAYSLVGRSRDPNGMKGDKRNFLFKYYAAFLKKYKPKYFVFENVLGLLTAGNKKYLTEMLELFAELGYSTDYKVLNSEDYGVLQKRRRVIIIGRKGKSKFIFPELELMENKYEIKKDLFYDLPVLRPGQEMEIAKYTKPINEYLNNTETRNGVDFTTQHITRNHNKRDLAIYKIAIDKWINEGQRLKYNTVPKSLHFRPLERRFNERIAL